MKYPFTDIEMSTEVAERFERQRQRSHGSPYDRGASDSYYRRSRNPHKWVFPGSNGRVWDEITELSLAEITDYYQGFNDNEAEFNFKDWG